MPTPSAAAAVAAAPTPTAYGQAPDLRRHRFTIILDADLVQVAQDQAQSAGMDLARWVDAYANEALKVLLFG